MGILNMDTWKRILLKFVGMGLGIGIGLALAVGFYVWHSSRPVPPKPWDSAAITATFLYADTTGDDNHCRFRYILENHTDRDYRTKTADLTLSAVLQEKSSLTGAGTGEVKFEEDTIFLPAKDHAEVEIELTGYSFPDRSQPNDNEGVEKYRDAVKKYVDEHLPRLNGFAAFDDTNRYRINFPKGWHAP
jgi:hypothetical protein